MIVLDANIVSEPMRRNGDPAVQAWLDRQAAETLYLTTTSLSELLLGIEILSDDRRKKGLASALNELLSRLLGTRILAFDAQASTAYALLVGSARAQDYSVSIADGQIAAITIVHGHRMATRDTPPFLAAGVAVINPWTEPSH